MRDLAKIVTIETKNRMFEKDRICVVTFKELGYEAIVPVSVNVGDRMVFIQEGSILPEAARWEFLRKRCYVAKLKGFLIRPMVMGAKDDNGQKGDRVKSWGLCVTLAEAGLKESLKAGTDVTEELKIRKYEPAEDASPKAEKTPNWVRFCLKYKPVRWIGNIWLKLHQHKKSGHFPTEIIQKSDETTIQNCKEIISGFSGKKAYVTAKMEGQSATMSLDPKKKYSFYVCSRNNRFDSVSSRSKDFFHTAEIYDVEKKLRAYLKRTGVLLVLQGEQCGPGIQGNIYDFDDNKLFIYRMKGLYGGKWVEYPYPKMKAVADELGFDCVPLVEVVDDMGVKFNVVKTSVKDEDGNDIDVCNTAEVIDSLVKYAEASYWVPGNWKYEPKANEKLWKNYLQNEGVVIKSEDYDKELGTGFSFKVKNCQYAEKQYCNMHDIAHALKK